MIRLIVQNGGRAFKGDELNTGFKTFEIMCPELERLLVAADDDNAVTLLGMEICKDPPPRPVIAPPAAPLPAAVPVYGAEATAVAAAEQGTLRQRLRDKWRKS